MSQRWSLLAACPDGAACPPLAARLMVFWNVLPAFAVYGAMAALFFVRPTVTSGVLFAVLMLRYLSITVGYHRFLAHHSFRTSRVLQFLIACVGCTCLQRGPLWWAAIHRQHHHHTDTPLDPHSPVEKGLWHSFFGWTLMTRWLYPDWRLVRDLTRYPELVWINKWWMIPPLLLVTAVYAIDGWAGVVWGYCLTTVLIFTSAFSINAIGHTFGPRRYDTAEQSRNNFWLGLLAGGDGWHNNHHRYPASAQQGLAWYELDSSYLAIRMLALVGLAWNVRRLPPEALAALRGESRPAAPPAETQTPAAVGAASEPEAVARA